MALDQAGCFSIVLECVPAELAAMITERVSIPTIGIGAGPACDGQVLVFHDLLGLYDGHTPKFVRRYANIAATRCDAAIEHYLADVRDGSFPDVAKESFHSAATTSCAGCTVRPERHRGGQHEVMIVVRTVGGPREQVVRRGQKVPSWASCRRWDFSTKAISR